MKKEERLHRLFGDIDDDLVADAAARPIPLKVWLPRVTAAVAAVALTVGLVLTQPWVGDDSPVGTITTTTQTAPNGENGEVVDDPTHQVPTDTAPDNVEPSNVAPPTTTSKQGSTTTAGKTNETWYEPKWDEKPIWQQFPDFERVIPAGYDGKMNYTVRAVTVSAALVEEHLEDVNLHGYDIYTETGYDIVGKIYRIKGINPNCAVALQYEGRTDYFPAVNGSYTPETLGAFITDVNLRENMTVGTVYGKYLDEQNFTHTAEYVGLTVEAVWELLLQKTDAANEYDYEKVIELDGSMDIAVSVPLLGIHNLSLRVTVDGYLFTNLMDTGKIFYIGEDATAAFMDYVRNHCRINYDSGPMSGETTTVYAGTTTTSAAQPPLATGTTVWKEPPV